MTTFDPDESTSGRVEQVAQAIGQTSVHATGHLGSGDLSVGAQRTVASVALVDQVVDRQLRERVESIEDHRAEPIGGRLGLGMRALAGLGDDDVDDAQRVLVGSGHPHRRCGGGRLVRASATGSRRSPRG